MLGTPGVPWGDAGGDFVGLNENPALFSVSKDGLGTKSSGARRHQGGTREVPRRRQGSTRDTPGTHEGGGNELCLDKGLRAPHYQRIEDRRSNGRGSRFEE